MPNQYYLNQKVLIKTGNTKIKGSVKDMDNDRAYYLIQTEYGSQLLESQTNLEPDFDYKRNHNGYKAF